MREGFPALRSLHWSSAHLVSEGLDHVLDQAHIGGHAECQDDTETDYDADPQTDCFVQVAWASLPRDWPGRLPARLFTAYFTSALTDEQVTAVNFSSSSTAVGYALAATPAIVRGAEAGEGWPGAYARIFEGEARRGHQALPAQGKGSAWRGEDTEERRLDAAQRAHLALARVYRDRVLVRYPEGRLWREKLYAQSGEALRVLLANPQLLRKAGRLIGAHRSAVAAAVAGDDQATLTQHGAIVSFLHDFAQLAPPEVAALAREVADEMAERAAAGEAFLGFQLR